MTQPLVIQLRFARNELMRSLEGVSDEEEFAIIITYPVCPSGRI